MKLREISPNGIWWCMGPAERTLGMIWHKTTRALAACCPDLVAVEVGLADQVDQWDQCRGAIGNRPFLRYPW
jgi:hypothetical protein